MRGIEFGRSFRGQRQVRFSGGAAVAPSAGGPVEGLEDRRMLAGDVVLQWNEVLLDAVRVARTAPPYAARNMAIVQTAVLDAVNAAGNGGGNGRADRGGDSAGASAVAAAAGAAHDALVGLYPAQKAVFDAALAASLAGVPDGRSEDRGVALGQSAAARVLADRADDGAADVVAYTPATGPGAWQPTPPASQPALLPNWPAVTPFAIDAGSQFRPAAPPDVGGRKFAAAFQEVKALGGATSATRTAAQTQIALFWADGGGTATPPGHWNEIAQDVAVQRGNTLAENARLFAALDVALADAGIAAWDSKYAYNCVRPVTAIRNAAADGNAATDADPAWTPLIATPPFPSYVSGHSTFSAAAATVLSGFFGTDRVRFTTTSDGLPGVKRTFTSFWAAAEEAGMSRIYGGIHFSFDNEEGLKLGRQVGRLIVREMGKRSSQGRGSGGGSVFSVTAIGQGTAEVKQGGQGQASKDEERFLSGLLV
jgi:membrane-associated phospholipid phosphatase